MKAIRAISSVTISWDSGSSCTLLGFCFPPTIFARRQGDCIGILRMEHGLLHELVDTFLCFLYLKDGGRRLPKGSTVLLSCVTSLTMLGQAGYADRVVAEAL